MEEETRGLAELKKELEDRIAQLEKELELLKNCLKVINENLAKSSFKPAIELITQTTASQQTRAASPKVSHEEEQEVQIRSRYGESLATMYIGRKHIRIVPAHDKRFSVKTPPFASFFLDRVLNEMKRKDEKNAERGEKYPEEVLRYDIRTFDGDAIAEIYIDNVLDEDRVREIKSAIRWTLERMYEKAARKGTY